MSEQAEHRTLVIIGAGPAGLAAAIYAARAHLSPLVLRGPNPGGQLVQTSTVENYPGFAHGVLGPELMAHFEAQALRFGSDMRYGCVTQVNFADRPLRVRVDDDWTLSADAIIIATGASPRWLGLKQEKALLGRGVSSCAICDGAFFKGQPVAVVGGGDAAIENALCLTRFSSHVYIIHRRDRLRASKVMQKLAFNHTKISFVWNATVKDILGEQQVEGLLLEELPACTDKHLPIQGVFVAIGHRPNTKIFSSWLRMDHDGYIFTRPYSTQTSVRGVFACGDAQDKVYRQAVTAAGTGCMAALDAERWLQKENLIQ